MKQRLRHQRANPRCPLEGSIALRGRLVLGTSILVAVFLLSWLTWASVVQAETRSALPSPLGYVSDFAGIVERDWRDRIRSVCKDLERKTGVEMVVVTTDSIEPFADVREYATALYRYWRIGSTQDEHGIMLVAYTRQPQVSVSVGRNMIPIIKPALLQEMTRRHVEPTFKLGHYGEGLYRSVVALASASQEVRVGAELHKHSKNTGIVLTTLIVTAMLLALWLLTRPEKRHPFPRIRNGEYWGTGRGGFGGNFGGFGGSTSGEGFS